MGILHSTNAVCGSIFVLLLSSSTLTTYAADRLADQRSRLGSIPAGMTAAEVIRRLGEPDEKRTLGKNGLLDGVRYARADRSEIEEAERWAYGPLGKGLFAATGLVSFDSTGTVVWAQPADCFCSAIDRLPNVIESSGDEAAKGPGGIVCQIKAIMPAPRAPVFDKFQVTVNIQNVSPDRLNVKHPAADHIRSLLIVRVFDRDGRTLFREDNARYSAAFPQGTDRTLSFAGRSETSETFDVAPGHGFGALPPGEYSLIVYFPFKEHEYYASNRFRFSVADTKKQHDR
jgi:hypothetical protein